MTYRNGRRALTRLVMNYRLHYGKGDDDKEAKGVVDDLLLSATQNNVREAHPAAGSFPAARLRLAPTARKRRGRREDHREHSHRAIQGTDCHLRLRLLRARGPRVSHPRRLLDRG